MIPNGLLKIILPALLSVLLLIPSESDGNEFKKTDEYAINAPERSERDILQLTAYLIKPFKNQKHKVRAIFTWITHHIAYDTESFLNGKFGAVYPEDILQRRKAVCEGYARLFKKMVKTAGMEAEFIGGYSKSYNYEPGSLFSKQNSHAWNAVKIDGQWYLLDVTWGAGYMDEHNKFNAMFNDYYFLTPPEQLIQSHFPNEVKWQLLDKKWSRADFEQSAYIKAAFFSYGIKTESHKQYQVPAEDSLLIILINPGDIQIVGRLYYNRTELDVMFIFTQNQKNKTEIRAVFPESAQYTLRLFAKRKSDSHTYTWIMDYLIDAKKTSTQLMGFVEKYSLFDDLNGYVYKPLNRFLNPGSVTNFQLRIDKVNQVVFIKNDRIIPLTLNGSLYSGSLPIDGDETVIAVKLNEGNQYHYILRYVAK
ncbi:MAG: arylamine N-acetyltransferase [Calditrichaceae bacterium]|nr:arylamine N-acetyltransferase [Calditrichaceae bacterium]MBN2708968.1 arylamine N-acetyltransferase [Calditrichaceae bacterium]RQV97509.1 MAG: hypothetical protein EH224_00375 [Calditrichota bacterium]